MKHLNWHPVSSTPGRLKSIWAIGLGIALALGILGWILKPYVTGPTKRDFGQQGIIISPDRMEGALNLEQATELLIDAIIQIESHGNAKMVGEMGERGLMQIRENTWKEVTRKHLGGEISFDRAFEPELNRRVGRYYLGDLQVFLYANRQAWKSDLRSLLLACYNAGPERVRRSGFNLRQLPKSVQSYAARGSALHDWYMEENAEAMHRLLIEAARVNNRETESSPE